MADGQSQGDIERLETAAERLRDDLQYADLDITERDAVNSALGHINLTIESLEPGTDRYGGDE